MPPISIAPIETLIASEINARPNQVEIAVSLIDEGATVPFIARYRKEQTGGLDDTQLRALEERLTYLRELEARRISILSTIKEQDKLTPDLEAKIKGVLTRAELEDLYLPYKPRRRTKAQIAREAGLEPLALALVEQPGTDPVALARDYLSPKDGIEAVEEALQGAAEIVIEQLSERAELVGNLRKDMARQGQISSKVKKGKENEGEKFSDYFAFSQDYKNIPSHRALALLRAEREGVLLLGLDVKIESDAAHRGDGPAHPLERKVSSQFNFQGGNRPRNDWLENTVHLAWKGKLHKKVSSDLIQNMKEKAEIEAISVFSQNLKDLLLAAPAGARVTIGLDPGFRNGVKMAVVDGTGKVLDIATIYPHEPRKDWEGSLKTLEGLVRRHNVEILSIGNGTASRETDKLCGDLIKRCKDLSLIKVMVSEAGASVYSASALAAKEFPDLDVSLRGAVSIARRLQDPLAELVKIDPKAIGVGQYQHDVNQKDLQRSLEVAIEDCVNGVGVDLNMASAELLCHVAGLNKTLADNIVAYRDQNGKFKARTELKKVPRLGPKAFEQAAGFLRIRDGKNPLDQSGVHPEAYGVVQNIAKVTARPVQKLIGDSDFLNQLKPADFATEQFGVPTVIDILAELEKPGRDPRPDFVVAEFQEGVEKISDLLPGMRLEGVVTNVTNFGAFVDVGVHQDGLVHISQMADKFVSDPREIVKAGDIVQVMVTQVDELRKRIGLSMKSDASPENDELSAQEKGSGPVDGGSRDEGNSNPFAEAFKRANKTRH